MHRNAQKPIWIASIATLFLLVGALGSAPTVAQAREPFTGHATAHLHHVPFGFSALSWESSTQKLTVTLKLAGLAPKSTHPAHIHQGDCAKDGPIVHPLKDVVADSAGIGTSTTTLSEPGGIPDGGWHINVYNGPTLATPEQDTAIACGNIENPQHLGETVAWLGPTSEPNQAASGVANLTLAGNTLTVQVQVHGLAPGSKHAVAIHQGSCKHQLPGTTVFHLNPLVADGSGNANETQTFHGVSSLGHDWYVAVHLSTDLGNQTGADPIACGDVRD